MRLFSYFGGKSSSAHRYPAPYYDTIVEPFAGAAGYASRFPRSRVILHEIDPVIAALWRYLIAATPEEILALPLVETGQNVDDLTLIPEARTLIRFWLNQATVTPCKTPSSWMRSGIAPTSSWSAATRHRIACHVSEIKHWRVVEASYAEADDIEATWFIDPPYQDKGRLYRCGSEALDFDHLGVWCRSRRGQVIVCEQAGATWLPFEPLGRVQTARRSGGRESAEVVWSAGPGCQRDLFASAGTTPAGPGRLNKGR